MKRIAKKDIESGRVKISKEDKERRERKKQSDQLNAALLKISDSLGAIKPSEPKDNSAVINQAADKITKSVYSLADTIAKSTITKWDFEVTKRNEKGFISKILAKGA